MFFKKKADCIVFFFLVLMQGNATSADKNQTVQKGNTNPISRKKLSCKCNKTSRDYRFPTTHTHTHTNQSDIENKDHTIKKNFLHYGHLQVLTPFCISIFHQRNSPLYFLWPHSLVQFCRYTSGHSLRWRWLVGLSRSYTLLAFPLRQALASNSLIP